MGFTRGWGRRKILGHVASELATKQKFSKFEGSNTITGSPRRQARDGIKSTSEQKRDEFRAFLSDASRPFIFGQTDRFIDELEMFLASGLNIEAYDKVCMQFLGMSASGRETRDRDVESYNQYPLVDFVDEDTERTD